MVPMTLATNSMNLVLSRELRMEASALLGYGARLAATTGTPSAMRSSIWLRTRPGRRE